MSEPESRPSGQSPTLPNQTVPRSQPAEKPPEATAWADAPSQARPSSSRVSARNVRRAGARNPGNGRRRRAAVALLAIAVAAAGVLWHTTRAGAPPGQSGNAMAAQALLARASLRSEFDFSNLRIPREAIRSGGPPRDGIPALTRPTVVPAAKATALRNTDRVVGVAIDGAARAYPLRILMWHEIVNDRLGGVPLVVTYCPLCDSAAVFDRRTSTGVREFGVSGLLFNSNVLMYAHGQKPFALWSQMMAQAVSGPQAGERLKIVPFQLTTWQAWRSAHPRTDVLSFNTGYGRNYGINPYVRYFKQPGLMFPVSPTSRRLPAKSLVLGVWVGNKAVAYPLDVLARQSSPITQQIDGHRFTLHYDAASATARVTTTDADVQWVYAFWFAWYAFHSQTEIYSGS